jgi:RNA-directed DNA polymerase
MQLIEEVASDENIELAFSWLCLKRKEHSPNNDVWNLRKHWQTVKPDLQKQLLDGTYQFTPQQEIRFDTETIELWASLDALVLKAVTLVLTRHLKPHISNQCVHVKGNGGGKEAVRQITKQLKDNSFVFRSDVKSYYASIDHHVLMEQLHSHINDARVITLIWDYLNRTVQFGGLYRDIKRGISLGCPLSPLIGALYLKLMDDRIISEKISIRVNGIDTPEIRGKCEKEKYDAQQAKEMVADILKDAKVVT